MSCLISCFRKNKTVNSLQERIETERNVYTPLPKTLKAPNLRNPVYFRTTCTHVSTTFDDLSFKVGTILEVEVNFHNDKYRARHLNSDIIGFVSKWFLEKESLYYLQPWFFDVDRNEAHRLLSSNENRPGSFLVRKSSKPDCIFVLTIRCPDSDNLPVIKHYQIFKKNEGYYLTSGILCASLENLVNLYLRDERNYLALSYHISEPCKKPGIS